MTTIPFFLAVALKGAVVLALAGLAALLLRHAPASARHGVWAAAFCGLLLLPVLEAMGPRWDISVLPSSGPAYAVPMPTPPAAPLPPAPPLPPGVVAFAPPGSPVHAADIADIGADVAAFEAEMAGFEAEMAGFEAEMEGFIAERARLGAEAASLAYFDVPGAAAPRWSSPVAWVVGAWALGAVLVALGWLSAFLAAHRLVRTATPEVDEEWAVLAERARRLSGLPAPVRLLRSDRLDVPIAWGYGRQAVVLPASSDAWSTDRREAVLLHEMAHLRRHDAWTQVLAQTAVALHWINPLAWVGYRRFLDAREQACDDAVIQGGARPSAYAEHLVGVARSLRRDRIALAAVAPMARRVPLESRVCSILDASRRRSSLGQPAVRRTVGLALVLVLPLAALRPVAEAQDRSAVDVSAQADSDVQVDVHADVETDTEADVLVEADVEADMEAAHAQIEATEADLEAAASQFEVTVSESTASGLDVEALERELDRSERALRETESKLIRLTAHAENDDDFCPEETLAALKRVGLSEEVRTAFAEALTEANVRTGDARAILAEVEAQIERSLSHQTIVVSASEYDAQRAAAEARRAALSFTVRGSSPPRPLQPRRIRVRRAAPEAPFDWDAVDRARRDAVRQRGASS